jgi:hypothetical protein
LRTFVKEVTLVLTNLFKSNSFLLVTDLLSSCFFSSNASVLTCLSGVAVVLLFLSSNEGSYFILLDRLLGDLFLSLISWVAFDTTFNDCRFEASLTALHGSQLLLLGLSLVKPLEEGVISGSDKVETARLSILLA